MSASPTYSPRACDCIYLTSDELEEVVPASIDATLDQSIRDIRYRMTIFNGSYLGVRRTGDHHGPGDYWINLAFLDPRPTRRADRFWSISAVILAVVTAYALSVMYSQSMAVYGPGLSIAVAVLSAVTLLGAALAIRGYFSNVIFLTRHGRVPVLQLSANEPDRIRVREFVRAIYAAIARAAADRADIPRGHFLRDEMKEHRRLQNAGVLDERQFRIARRLILEAHD